MWTARDLYHCKQQQILLQLHIAMNCCKGMFTVLKINHCFAAGGSFTIYTDYTTHGARGVCTVVHVHNMC